MTNRLRNHGIDRRPGTRVRDVTIVFTDIEDSTRRLESMGDIAWLRTLAAHHRIIRHRARQHRGMEVSAMGDGFLLVFESLQDAIACTTAIQRDIRDHVRRHPSQEIHVRVGIHTGETIAAEDAGLVGRNVHLASRVADQAAGGEILLTDAALERSDPPPSTNLGESRRAALRGLPGTHALHPLSWT